MEHFDNDFIRSRIHDSTTLDLLSDDLIDRISFGILRTHLSPVTCHRSQLDGIPVSVLFHILSHHLLMIASEYDFFSYISSRISSNPEALDLLQFIRFEYLLSECVSYFMSALPDSIDHRLWESMTRRLVSCRPHEVELPLTEAKSRDGIIFYLTRKHGGNVNDKGIVTLMSKFFAVLLHCRMPLTSQVARFSVRRRGHASGFAGIVTKRASSRLMDRMVDWTEIRSRPDHGVDSYWEVLFPVSNTFECRFIQLTQTGEDLRHEHFLYIGTVELFGI
jgi:hypothetical protein